MQGRLFYSPVLMYQSCALGRKLGILLLLRLVMHGSSPQSLQCRLRDSVTTTLSTQWLCAALPVTLKLQTLMVLYVHLNSID